MFFDLILYFFIYCVLGFLIETWYAFIRTGNYQMRRTMLYSPMCTVYGIGAIAMILTLSNVSDNYVFVFCGGFFVCSAIEYMVSLVSEKVYNILWWDYQNEKANLNGRICGFYSFCWGIIAIVFFKAVHPFAQGVVSRMDTYYKGLVCTILVVYFLKDFSKTSVELMKKGRGEQSLCDNIFPFVKIAK